MAIELRERLSEFSYGYGVTRETENLLRQIGIRPVPFLPSLLQEADLGFDVAFERPGAPLLLQFKLGQSLTRFVRSDLTVPAPPLDRPFWRFSINTAEPDGQFETLLKAETDGAEVYYAAPRFSDWPHYAELFGREEILDTSLLIKPSDIRNALDQKGAADGSHRIVYDRYRVHVCSKPVEIPDIDPEEAANKIAVAIRERRQPATAALQRLFEGFDDRSSIRRDKVRFDLEDFAQAADDVGRRAPGDYIRAQRQRRYSEFRKRAKSPEQALVATIGVELWAMGIQLILAVEA
ncbi:hypothetical protein [Sphingopyxis terrae]|uniref:hypothetical protein n=1 Tax=Sphingopyxis terrae TaxID=33052 RepID=UPI003F7E9656